jgi:integrase
LHPDLKSIIKATPSNHLTFIVTESGKPYAHAQSFGNRMRGWAKEAGLKGCPLHGLRKACLVRLAEAGCTAPEIMAISGHKSMAEVQRSNKGADQKVMAKRAIARTTSYPLAKQSYPREKKA